MEQKESTISEVKQVEFYYENIKEDPVIDRTFSREMSLVCNPGEKSQSIKTYEASKATAQQQMDNIQPVHDYFETSEKMKSGPPKKCHWTVIYIYVLVTVCSKPETIVTSKTK